MQTTLTSEGGEEHERESSNICSNQKSETYHTIVTTSILHVHLATVEALGIHRQPVSDYPMYCQETSLEYVEWPASYPLYDKQTKNNKQTN